MADGASMGNHNPKSWCFLGAVVLSVAHVMSVLGMWYQTGFVVREDSLVNFGIWLSPVIVLLVLGRTCVVVCAAAVPLTTIFVARAFYAYQRYSFGTNSVGAKGDWAFWLATFTGMASVAILVLWALYRIAVFFERFVSSRS